MEAVLQRDDILTAGALFARVQARKLDGAFVRLGAGIREERLPRLTVGYSNTLVQHIGEHMR